MQRARGIPILAALLIGATQVSAGGFMTTPEETIATLAELHPDYEDYIAQVRYGPLRLKPSGIDAGLVRPGGRDPRDPSEGPLRGQRNDLIIYTDTFDPGASAAWRRLLPDHEYFHARHMARGFDIPAVSFGQAQADHDYYEALAWGWVLRRARAGIYGTLTTRELAQVAARYERHFQGFHRFVMERQPAAWAHYGRFLPGPEIMSAASDAQATPGPVADSGLR
jgi:hypothetical protein